MDVDRRYFNVNTGTAATNYANINLQPGYQRLTGAAGARRSSASGTPTPTTTGWRASSSSCAR